MFGDRRSKKFIRNARNFSDRPRACRALGGDARRNRNGRVVGQPGERNARDWRAPARVVGAWRMWNSNRVIGIVYRAEMRENFDEFNSFACTRGNAHPGAYVLVVVLRGGCSFVEANAAASWSFGFEVSPLGLRDASYACSWWLEGGARGSKKMWTKRKVLVDYSSRMGNRPDTRCARPLSAEMSGPQFWRV